MSDKPKKISNYSNFEDMQDVKNYVRIVDGDLTKLFTYIDRFPRNYEQSAEPTIQRNTFALWRDTDDGKIYLICNISGNQKKVELT